MLFRKRKILLGLFLLVLGGCCDKEWVKWDAWRQDVLSTEKSVFTDPGERETFLKGEWLTGMSLRELKLTLEPVLRYTKESALHPKHVSSDGWREYEIRYNIYCGDFDKYQGTKRHVTFWFKDDELRCWSGYYYYPISYEKRKAR